VNWDLPKPELWLLAQIPRQKGLMKKGVKPMSKNLIGARIKAEKEKIIKMYKDDIPISDIAKEYGVVSTSLWQHLKNWGVSMRRKVYQRKEKKVNNFKRKFSPELQAKMEENTRINNKYIKFYSTIETGNDKFLVRNILKESKEVANE